MQYKIVPMSQTLTPNGTVYPMGYPEPQECYADLALLNIDAGRTEPLNSIVLRNAIINSKELLKAMGIYVYTQEEEDKIRAVQKAYKTLKSKKGANEACSQ